MGRGKITFPHSTGCGCNPTWRDDVGIAPYIHAELHSIQQGIMKPSGFGRLVAAPTGFGIFMRAITMKFSNYLYLSKYFFQFKLVPSVLCNPCQRAKLVTQCLTNLRIYLQSAHVKNFSSRPHHTNEKAPVQHIFRAAQGLKIWGSRRVGDIYFAGLDERRVTSW